MAKYVQISDLVIHTNLQVVQGEAYLDRPIYTSEVWRPGLELTGYFHYYPSDRIQIIGETEMSFINGMTSQGRLHIMRHLCDGKVPCFVISRGLAVPQELLQACQEKKIPVLQSTIRTTRVASIITTYIETQLARRESRHGVLVDIHGVGTMITGESGIGKSETALELVQKGHRLVADDRIDMYAHDDMTLIGEAPGVLSHLLEIRGIGIIDVMNLFGIGSVRATSTIDLIVHLEPWDQKKMYDRLGRNEKSVEILKVTVPQITLPVRTGRNMANIIEVAAVNFRAKKMGYDATETFQQNLSQLIAKNTASEQEKASGKERD